MNLPRILLSSLLIAIAGGCATSAPPTPAAPPPRSVSVLEPAWEAQIRKARAVLAPRIATHPAVAVAVAIDGRIVWSEANGWADVASQREAKSSTRFRLYSTAKALTGTLALRLEQAGRLDLDTAIGTYLPDLPSHLQKLMMRQLLGHLGGVRHYRDGEWMKVSSSRCTNARDALSQFADDPLVAGPGTEYAYSSFGFVLASAVIEAAGGASFTDLLYAEILGPAEMTGTGVDTPAAHDDNTSSFYWEGQRGRVVEAPVIDNSCKFGAGGILTTVDDLARFGVALLDRQLVDSSGIDVLFSPQTTSAGANTGYSLGWGVSEDGSWIGHSGGSPGGRSYLLVDRRHRVVIAVLSNFEGEGLSEEVAKIREIFIPAESR